MARKIVVVACLVGNGDQSPVTISVGKFYLDDWGCFFITAACERHCGDGARGYRRQYKERHPFHRASSFMSCHDLQAAFFAALFCFAHLFRCAAAMRARASALMCRFFSPWVARNGKGASLPRRARTSRRRASSESIAERSSGMFM